MLEAILVNITASLIYDILKSFKVRVQQSIFDIEKDANLRKIVETFIEDYEIDSGSLARFLTEYSTKVAFNQFIRYNSFKSLLNNEDMPFSIDKEEFVDLMVISASNYAKNEIHFELNKKALKRYFYKLIEIIEDKIIYDFPTEYLALPYFLSRAISDLESKISQIVKYETKEINIEAIKKSREQYLSALKPEFQECNVYGVRRRLRFESFYVPPTLMIQQEHYKKIDKVDYITLNENNKDFTVEWQHLFAVTNVVSVIGGAGFGKTLFLRNLMNNFNDLDIYDTNEALPIYCNLKDIINETIGKATHSVFDFLLESMKKYSGLSESYLNKEFLSHYINTGKCIILFDALDEVEGKHRNRVSNIVQGYLSTINKNNKVCITTRDRSLIPDTPVIYRVKPLDNTQIKNYLDKMIELGNFDSRDIDIFIKQSSPLLENGFLTSFLVLSLLVKVFDSESKLPENKIELYELCVKYISKRREEEKEVQYDFKLMHTILENDESFEQLALLCKPNNKEIKLASIHTSLMKTYRKRYRDENDLSRAIKEFLRFCEDRTELFIMGNSEDKYKFFHRSFFEFFYAKYCAKHLSQQQILNELIEFGDDSELTELTISILKKNAYTTKYIPLIDLCIKNLKRTSKYTPSFSRVYNTCLEALHISDEEHYLNEFYDMCMNNTEKYLLHLKPETELMLLPLFLRTKKVEELVKDFIIKNVDIISAYVCQKVAIDKLRVDQIANVLPITILEYIEKNANYEMVELINSLSDKEIINSYNELGIHMMNTTNKVMEVKDIIPILRISYMI